MGVLAGAARHAVWYLRYQVEGITHDQPERAARDDARRATRREGEP